MDRHLGPFFAHLHDQAGVGHDERVGLERDDGLDVAQVGAHLVVVRDQVAGDEELFAARTRLGHALRELLEAEFVVARTQAVARLAGIDGVGAEVVGSAHFFQRAGGQQQFRGFEGHGAYFRRFRYSLLRAALPAPAQPSPAFGRLASASRLQL